MKHSGVSQPTSPEAQLSQSESSKVSQSSKRRQVYQRNLFQIHIKDTFKAEHTSVSKK